MHRGNWSGSKPHSAAGPTGTGSERRIGLSSCVHLLLYLNPNDLRKTMPLGSRLEVGNRFAEKMQSRDVLDGGS
jgi:hypothetical protein